MKARVTVTLRSGVLDPQGKAIEGALRSLGIEDVASVRQGKIFDIEMVGADRAVMGAALEEAATRLLANPVIEDFEVALEEAGPLSLPPAPQLAMVVAAEPAPDERLPAADATEAAAAAVAMPTEGHP